LANVDNINIEENRHPNKLVAIQKDISINKPFDYSDKTNNEQSLKTDQDSSEYSKFLSKSSSIRKSRFEIEKVSPHEFSNDHSKEKSNDYSLLSDDHASENFSQVHEDQKII